MTNREMKRLEEILEEVYFVMPNGERFDIGQIIITTIKHEFDVSDDVKPE